VRKNEIRGKKERRKGRGGKQERGKRKKSGRGKERERWEKGRREEDWGSECMTRVPVESRRKCVPLQVSSVLIFMFMYVYL